MCQYMGQGSERLLHVPLKNSSADSSVNEVISEAMVLKDEFDEELQVMIMFLYFIVKSKKDDA